MQAPGNASVHERAAPRVSRVAANAASAATGAPSALSDAGRPLDNATRDFFEPRLGQKLGDVRVHTNDAAAASAQSVDARAYTLGHDVVFDRGEYDPGSDSGRHTLAHELTHVVQQRAGAPMLQRLARGAGAPPGGWAKPGGGTFTLSVVPPDDVDRVDAAIEMVREVVNDPSGFSACHEYFQDHCSPNPQGVLQQAFNNAVIWKLTDPSGEENARGDVNGVNIAYTTAGYDQGTQGLAATFMHEMMHNCGNAGGDDHWRAAAAATYCVRKENNTMGVRFNMSDETFMMTLTYRRILGEIAQGHLRFTAGGDLNIVGSVLEITDAATGTESGIPHELGSAMVGAEARTSFGGALGGERFGGFYGRVDTGFGVGRFRLTPTVPPDPDAPETGIHGSYLLQLSAGVEFLIPTNPHVFPLRLEAGYRMAQPLTDEAERLNTFSLGVEFPF